MNKHFIPVISFMLLTQIVFAQTVWNGKTDTDWYDGSKDEFTITTAEQLAGFAELVNGGHTFNGQTVKLGRNIFLNNTTNWKSWASKPPARIWTPIGGYDKSFEGTFNGNGFVINGVYVNNLEFQQGLFGKIGSGFSGSGGMIENLGVTSSYIRGRDEVGGLVGKNYRGNINNSYYIGIVNYSDFGMWRGGEKIGGLVGNNMLGIISNSYSIGTVTGEEAVGGLVGENNSGTISNSYSMATVTGNWSVGGFVGENGGIIKKVILWVR